MKIPEVREKLLDVAHYLDRFEMIEASGQIRALVKEMYRRPYVRKAKAKRTRPPKAEVVAYAAAHPEADYVDISNYFATNPGRISEDLAGYRK